VPLDTPEINQLFQNIRHPLKWYREGGPENPFEAEVRQRRIRIVLTAAGALALIGVGFGIYAYIAGLEGRSERAFLEGVRLFTPNHYPEALAQFDRAISLNGSNEQAHLARGDALALMGNKSEALNAFNRVIEIKPQWARGYAARGKFYRDAGDFDKALVDLNMSVQLEENPENLIERGQVFAAQSKWQKAIDDYTLYIKLREGVPYPYRLRSVARKQLGDEAGAQEDKEQALIYEGKTPNLFGKTERIAAPPPAAPEKKK